MPTQEFKQLLDRDFSVIDAKQIIELIEPILIETVNYATWVFQRCQSSTSKQLNIDFAPIIIYRQIIEFMDSIEILVSNSSSIPMIPLLRTIFESCLSLEYMFEKNYEIRSLSWLCTYLYNRIESYKYTDKTSKKREKINEEIKEKFGETSPLLTSNISTAKYIEDINSLLDSEQLKRFKLEYMNRKKERKSKYWYSFFGGPKNLRELADDLDRLSEYVFLYKNWSSIVHCNDASRYLTSIGNHDMGFWSLRNPSSLRELSSFAITFLLRATRLMIDKFRNGENFSQWYIEEIKQQWNKLWKTEIKIN